MELLLFFLCLSLENLVCEVHMCFTDVLFLVMNSQKKFENLILYFCFFLAACCVCLLGPKI